MNKVNTKHENTLINPKNLIIQLVIFIVSTITIINLLCTALDIIQWHDEFVTLFRCHIQHQEYRNCVRYFCHIHYHGVPSVKCVHRI